MDERMKVQYLQYLNISLIEISIMIYINIGKLYHRNYNCDRPTRNMMQGSTLRIALLPHLPREPWRASDNFSHLPPGASQHSSHICHTKFPYIDITIKFYQKALKQEHILLECSPVCNVHADSTYLTFKTPKFFFG